MPTDKEKMVPGNGLAQN